MLSSEKHIDGFAYCMPPMKEGAPITSRGKSPMNLQINFCLKCSRPEGEERKIFFSNPKPGKRPRSKIGRHTERIFARCDILYLAAFLVASIFTVLSLGNRVSCLFSFGPPPPPSPSSIVMIVYLVSPRSVEEAVSVSNRASAVVPRRERERGKKSVRVSCGSAASSSGEGNICGDT